MRKVCLVLAALGLVSITIGCTAPRAPFGGGVTMPIYVDVSDALMVNAGDIPDNLKVGTSTAQSIVGVNMGDSSIDTARRNAQIKKIHYVDYHSWSIMGVYSKTTTRVYGE